MNHDYPNDADVDALRNVGACGNDMTKPMDIDFHIAAPDESTAKRVAKRATKLGYRTRIWFDDKEQDQDEDCLLWTCECTKTMAPEYDQVVAFQAELDRIARPLGAYVDGWGTFGNVDQASP